MHRKRLAVLVTSVVATLAATVAAPAPALAGETCQNVFSLGTQTIEVLGQPVAHSPRGGMWICLETPDGVPAAPSLEVTTSPARIVQLVHPDAGGGEVTVRILFDVATYEGPTHDLSRTVTVPIPMDGGKTCLFFQGNAVYNPGGCVVAINGSSSLDEIFDLLP